MRLSNSARTEIRGGMMVQKIGLTALCAGLLSSGFCEESKVEYKPLDFGGFSEFGLLKSGQYGETHFTDEWVDHFGAYVAQTAQANENLAFDIGLGGVFEYQKREVVSSQWGGTQYKNFFIGPSVADIRYGASAGSGHGFGLQFGMFNYKYNPDASNLGEYLFRSGTYPGYVTSGGFWFVNNSAVQLQALRGSYGTGNLTTDLFLITETSMPALYDISGAAVLDYKVADGLLDLGAGLNWKHMIPVKPSRTSPQIVTNGYFTKNGTTYSANPDYYNQKASYYQNRGDADSAAADAERALIASDAANAAAHQQKVTADSLSQVAFYARAAEQAGIKAKVTDWDAHPADSGISMKYFTQSGLIGMLRASLDLKKLFASDAFGEKDMRLYAEMAVLGIQNYPFYYEKITERMPIMVGFNVPTLKLLDILSIEMEYYNSPYLNSYTDLVGTNSAVPTKVQGSDMLRSKSDYSDITKHDDVSWSIFAKRTLGGNAYLAAQVARDHIRTVSIETWTAPEPTQVLGRSKDWYWMLQFGFGI